MVVEVRTMQSWTNNQEQAGKDNSFRRWSDVLELMQEGRLSSSHLL
jgi:hypothetical protein